jgi:lipoate-protein ligase A
MALDKALLDYYQPGKSMPIFRFYRWLTPAISLGRFQQAADILNIKNCHRDNIDIVRRITGGGAIYHLPTDLTYSLVCDARFFGSASVKESYRLITQFLIDAYRQLGFKAAYARDIATDENKLGQRSDFCFSGFEQYDILINGRKIGGNAQKRKRQVIFQHGSLPLELPGNIGDYFLTSKIKKNNYLSLSHLNFSDIHKLKEVLIKAISDNLGIKLIPGRLKGIESMALKQYQRKLKEQNNYIYAAIN